MPSKPTGTVTFLFTDIENSTKLAREYPEAMLGLLARHHEILNESLRMHGGYAFQTEGDSFAVAFHSAKDALNAALAAQRALHNEAWSPAPIKVRMGIHTGTAELNPASAPIVYSGYTAVALTQRIMSAGHGGQILVSGATENLLLEELPRDVSLRDMGRHTFKDVPQAMRVFQVIAPGLPQDFPLLRALDILPNNLPAQLTSFVGREKELTDIKRLLQNTHLLTLIGPGGTGKTRLSIQAASEMLEQYPDGAWFVELAPILDPQLVPRTTAMAMGLRDEPQRPVIDMLCDYLHEKKILIVLDNCEHLVDACARMADRILHAAPDARILASSREALGISGEVTYRVPSLELPDISHLPPLEPLSQYEAVRLFIDRATAAVPTFAVTNDNAPALAQVCHHLDGMPLAIELAAAKIRVLSVEQIAKRLDDRFRLLAGGNRTVLERHQTLRAAIDWSFNLLSPREQALFQRLSVFVGGWTLEGAESVCNDETVKSDDILELLEQLINKSLVIKEEAEHESRYHMLETIRQYTHEKLLETDETAPMRDRHLEYFRTFAEKAEIEILSSNQLAWLKSLSDEFDNIRAGLEWSRETRVEDGLRLGSAVWRFCLRYGYTNELIDKLSQLLKYPPAVKRTSARAKTLCVLSILAVWHGDLKKMRSLAEESMSIYKELEDQHGLAASLYALGVAANNLNDPASLSLLLQSLELYRAMNDRTDICDVLIVISQVSNDAAQRQACLEEALALARERGDAITMAGALDNLGILAKDLGNFSQARSWLEESLKLQRPLGAPGFVTTLQYLGEVVMYEGNLVAARAYCEEAVSMSKNAGMTANFLWSLSILGDIALREEKWDESKAIFVEVLRRYRSLERTNAMIYPLEALASVAAHQSQPDRAVRLFAFGTTMRRAKNHPRHPLDQPIFDRNLAFIKAQIDDSTFEALWAEGQALTLQQAIELAESQSGTDSLTARAEREIVPDRLLSRQEMDKQKYGGLTIREREVAAQIAQGKSDQAIATELFVGLKTVEAHVTRILTKLGFTSRAQIAAWAVAKGLAEAPQDLDTLGRDG